MSDRKNTKFYTNKDGVGLYERFDQTLKHAQLIGTTDDYVKFVLSRLFQSFETKELVNFNL